MQKPWFLVCAVAALGCGTPVVMTPPVGCTASTCAGCCDSAGRCQGGAEVTACGRLGLACATCQSGQVCAGGLCSGPISTGGGAGGGSAGGDTAGGDAGGSTAGGNPGGGAAGGDAGGTAGGAVTGGGGAGGGSAFVRSRQFQATPIRFAVPGTVYNALTSSGGTRHWSTIDLNGDGRVDLALTSNPLTGAVFATGTVTHWNVHLGTAVGFSGTVTQWPVPANASLPQGYNVADSATGSSFWATFDLTGDGRPDLLHTMNPTSMGPYVSMIGSATDGWLTRRGSTSGFVATNVTTTVPRVTGLSGGIDRPFSDANSRRWALAEMTGDALPDLVITADPTTDLVWATPGQSSWVVCPGTTAGFGAFSTCRTLAVPDSATPGGFKSTSSFAASLRRVWLLVDLTGDGRDDLVQTMNPAAMAPEPFYFSVGAPAWKVWPNTFGTGVRDPLFASTPIEWSVPSRAFSTSSSATSPLFWEVMDLDGDGVPEFVQTSDPSTGRVFPGSLWNVYTANGSGFGPGANTWPVPAGPAPDGFRSVSGAGWQVLDVTGDRRPDLVQFQDPATGQAFSDSSGAFWRVYPGTP